MTGMPLSMALFEILFLLLASGVPCDDDSQTCVNTYRNLSGWTLWCLFMFLSPLAFDFTLGNISTLAWFFSPKGPQPFSDITWYIPSWLLYANLV